MEDKLCRIAVFYDGTYLFKVSNYYLYQHERRARLSFKGLHEFIAVEVAKHENVDVRRCQVVDAAYFRGRLSAQQAQDQSKLFSDRIFEDVLMRAGVTLFQRPLRARANGGFEEKGIDVWLALEAYEMASLKRYDVCVLVTGDGDFVPLVNKLNTLGSRVMLMAWDFEYERDGRPYVTRAATELIDRVNYPIMMDTEIDSRERRKDSLINGLFMEKDESVGTRGTDHTVPRNTDEPQPTSAGSIIKFDSEKGYGFITPDSEGENLFFHIKDVIKAPHESIDMGARVTYAIGRNDKGSIATNVQLA